MQRRLNLSSETVSEVGVYGSWAMLPATHPHQPRPVRVSCRRVGGRDCRRLVLGPRPGVAVGLSQGPYPVLGPPLLRRVLLRGPMKSVMVLLLLQGRGAPFRRCSVPVTTGTPKDRIGPRRAACDD